MGEFFVENNEGGGFDIEDEDVDDILNAAAAREDNDEGDTSHFFNIPPQPEKKKSIFSKRSNKSNEDITESFRNENTEDSSDVNDEDSLFSELEDNEESSFNVSVELEEDNEPSLSHQEPEKPKSRWDTSNDNYSSSYQEPSSLEYEQTVKYEEPEPVYSEPQIVESKPRTLNIKSETDQINHASRIIKVVDILRSLKSDDRQVVEQIITESSDITEDEATIAIKAINADSMLSTTIRSLKEAKKSGDVERVFFIISLDDEVLYNLGRMVYAFTDNYIDENLGKIDYARQLVSDIAGLDNSAVKYITSTESVLAAASEENE